MKIALLGKFKRLHDEEYIARSFEALGHQVARVEVDEFSNYEHLWKRIDEERPKMAVYGKLNARGDAREFFRRLRHVNVLAVCWIFDLYVGYPREHRLNCVPFRAADWFFSTDGGNDEGYLKYGIRNNLLRQGIYAPECYIEDSPKEHDVVFVGSHNPLYEYRQGMLSSVNAAFPQFKWFGMTDTNEVRGRALNSLYGKSKVVVGDSVHSPSYWSNRVVETLGRGGFLIHPEVEGIREEYPGLVTYRRGDFGDLNEKIGFFIKNDSERESIRRRNHEWVRERYTMDKKCELMIRKIYGDE